jgi:hypothetical protein
MTRDGFPGFEACLKMMRNRRNPQEMEDGFSYLRERAAEFVPELMSEFGAELDSGLKCWLLELIGEARNAQSLELLIAQLDAPDESLREWAKVGLKELNTRESRKALFQFYNRSR